MKEMHTHIEIIGSILVIIACSLSLIEEVYYRYCKNSVLLQKKNDRRYDRKYDGTNMICL